MARRKKKYGNNIGLAYEIVVSLLMVIGGIFYYALKALFLIVQGFAEGLAEGIKGQPYVSPNTEDNSKPYGFGSFVKETFTSYEDIVKDEVYEHNNYLDEEEEHMLAVELADMYNKAVDRLRTLVGYTENKLYYQIVKTEFPGEGRIREYVNFLTYDRQTVAVENANDLVNKVLNNVLCTYKGRSKKLQNTIVLDDYACDMKDISRNIAEKIGVDEIQMLMS